MTTEPALVALRVGTRAEHERVERLLRLETPMSMQRYTTVMAGFDAFLAAWEPRIADALPERLKPWFSERRRGHLAHADVRWLASTGVQPLQAMRVDAVHALALDETAATMGSLYVLEGSALGGRVLCPQLRQTLGVGPGRGCDYFEGFGDATGAMWRDFRQVSSEEIGDSPQAVAAACEAAKNTFEAMLDAFALLPPP